MNEQDIRTSSLDAVKLAGEYAQRYVTEIRDRRVLVIRHRGR
jgi:hypothetical protein